MTIGVEIYTRRNPRPLLKILQGGEEAPEGESKRVKLLKNIGDPENIRTYLLALTGSQKYAVRLRLSTHPMRYPLDVSPQSEQEYLRREGIKNSPFPTLPGTLRKKAEKDGGQLFADGELYGIALQYPQLVRATPFLEPLWGIVNFSQGGPLYIADIEIDLEAPGRVLQAVVRLTEHLRSKYDGLVWDGHNREFDRVSVGKLMKAEKEVYLTLDEQLDNIRLGRE